MTYQEQYHAVALGANAVYKFPQGAPTSLGGFLCKTAGTLTATTSDGTLKIDAFPVAAGTYYSLPFRVGADATVTLAGGASGTLGTC